MKKFFYPESLVVVGVSPSITNLAKRILYNLRRFRYDGKIYAVGTHPDEVEGFQLYTSIEEIKDSIDLAIILVPAKKTIQVVTDCGEKGIKNVIIESGGFREFAESGDDLEQELLATCKKYGISLIGPNCMGVINQENGLCSPFITYVAPFSPGGLSIISQSGGVGMSYALDLSTESVGINKFISYGNGVDIDEVDLIEYLGKDKGTKVISAYIEGSTRGREFLRVISRQNKPVVVLKSNTQKATAPVAASHSAAMSGGKHILRSALKQVGVLSVPNTLVWTNVSKQLTLPLMKGNRLAILSRSGGHAVLAADAAGKFGFELPSFPKSFFESCHRYFEHSVIHLQNPLDLGQIFYPPVLGHILEETLKLDEIDGILLIHSYNSNEGDSDLAHQFIGQLMPLMKRYDKPISTVLFTNPSERQYVGETYKLPNFNTPFHGVQALAYSRDALRLAERRRPFDSEPPQKINSEAKKFLKRIKSENRPANIKDAFELMELYGVNLSPYGFAYSRTDLAEIGRRVGYPVALKLVHSQATHKSDIGGVMLDLRDEGELLLAWEEIDLRANEAGLDGGITMGLVQRMSKEGCEMYVGARRDIAFGPVVMTGMGGVFTEVIDDTSIRVAPLTAADANDMLEETKGYKLLEGFRSNDPADTYSLIELILKVSQIMIELDDIEEIELNPVTVHQAGQSLTVLDARIEMKIRQ